MAAAQVFGIGELVERILLCLPTKELLLSKRINKECETAHDKSIKIKKALFLVPGVANNTSDEASFPVPRFSASSSALKRWWSHDEYSVPLPAEANDGVSFNPLLVDYFSGQRLAISHNRASGGRSRIRFRKPVKYYDKQWSCHRMFVSQPPLRIMTVNVGYVGRYHGLHMAPIRDWMEGGMLYGDLIDELEQLCKGLGVSLHDFEEWDVGMRSVYADEDMS